MAGEWPTVRVEDLAEKIAMGPFGSSIKVETFVNEGVPVISGAHLRGVRVEDGDFNFVTGEHAGRLKNSNIKRGDVIFTHAGNIGQCAYVPDDSKYDRYVISQRQFYLRCNDKADPAFITYYFHSGEGQQKLLANASQVGVPSIARPSSYLKTIEIALPPIEEQRAIARILGALDDRIELNRRMNQTLEAMARALFKSWFIDFDGVPPEDMHDSERGPIPKGWEVRSVGDFAKLTGGKQLEKELIEASGDIPVFGGAGVMGYTKSHNADGFVISVGRVGAYCGQFFSHRGKAWINNNASLIHQNDEILSEWLFIALRHADIDVIKKGAAQPFVSNGDIAKLPLLWPGERIVKDFSRQLSSIFKRKEANESMTRILESLRDTLLPKLISGELRVKDAGRMMGNAG